MRRDFFPEEDNYGTQGQRKGRGSKRSRNSMSGTEDPLGGGSSELSTVVDTGRPRAQQVFLLSDGKRRIIIESVEADGTVHFLNADGESEKLTADEFRIRRQAGEYLTHSELAYGELVRGELRKVDAPETRTVPEHVISTVPETPVGHSAPTPEMRDPEVLPIRVESVSIQTDQARHTPQEPGENSADQKKEFKRLEKELRVFLNKSSGLAQRGKEKGQYRLKTAKQTEYFSPQKLRDHLAKKLREMRAMSEGDEDRNATFEELKREIEKKLGGDSVNLDMPETRPESISEPDVPQAPAVSKPEKARPSADWPVVSKAEVRLQKMKGDLIVWIANRGQDLRKTRNLIDLDFAKEIADAELKMKQEAYFQDAAGEDQVGGALFADYQGQLDTIYSEKKKEFPEKRTTDNNKATSEESLPEKIQSVLDRSLEMPQERVQRLLDEINRVHGGFGMLEADIRKETEVNIIGGEGLEKDEYDLLRQEIDKWQKKAAEELFQAVKDRKDLLTSREWIAKHDKVVKNGEVYRKALADAREQWTALEKLIKDPGLSLEGITDLRADIPQFGMDTSTLDPSDVEAAEKWNTDRRADALQLLDQRERKLNPPKKKAEPKPLPARAGVAADVRRDAELIPARPVSSVAGGSRPLDADGGETGDSGDPLPGSSDNHSQEGPGAPFEKWRENHTQNLEGAGSFGELKICWEAALKDLQTLEAEHLMSLPEQEQELMANLPKVYRENLQTVYVTQRQKFISALDPHIPREMRSILNRVTDAAEARADEIEDGIRQVKSPGALEGLEGQVRKLMPPDFTGILLGGNTSGMEAFAEDWLEKKRKILFALIKRRKDDLQRRAKKVEEDPLDVAWKIFKQESIDPAVERVRELRKRIKTASSGELDDLGKEVETLTLGDSHGYAALYEPIRKYIEKWQQEKQKSLDELIERQRKQLPVEEDGDTDSEKLELHPEERQALLELAAETRAEFDDMQWGKYQNKEVIIAEYLMQFFGKTIEGSLQSRGQAIAPALEKQIKEAAESLVQEFTSTRKS